MALLLVNVTVEFSLSTKWNTKKIESQRSSLGPYWTFLVLTELQIEDNRHWHIYRSTKWNTKTNESQRSSLGPYWTFLVLTEFQIEDNRHWHIYRSTKWNTKTNESQRSSLGPYWTFLVLTEFQIEDNRHWPALRGLSSPPSTNTREPWPFNGAKVPLEAYTGSKKSCHKNVGARPAVEYVSVLSQ